MGSLTDRKAHDRNCHYPVHKHNKPLVVSDDNIKQLDYELEISIAR